MIGFGDHGEWSARVDSSAKSNPSATQPDQRRVLRMHKASMTNPYSGPVSDAEQQAARPQTTTFVMSKTKEAARAGITMGSALAITISWSVNHSILWAILHGFFSWLYVIYFVIVKR